MTKSIHGPVYALALAIVVLAVAVYFKDASKSGDADEKPLIALPQANSVTQLRELPPAITIPAVANEACCGGELCKPPQKNTSDSYCAITGKCEQCPSKRKLVTGACKDQLDPQRPLLLRLASVDLDSPHTEVCFRRKDDPRSSAMCVLRKDVQDPTAPRLPITTQDLLGGKIFVEINEGGKNLARGTNPSMSGLKTSALCVGLAAPIGNQKIKVEFFLDDP
jgi:hypothetical protein